MAKELLELALLLLVLWALTDMRRRLAMLEKALLNGQVKEERKLLKSDERRVKRLDGKLRQ